MRTEQLGPYQIVRELGRGGMGVVFEAVNLETQHPAAIKLLSAKLAREEGFRERFAAEIETLRKLNHPNIVRLFGFGDQDEHLYYAMELVDGRSVEQELQHGRRFNWREVARIGIETCWALRHAHDRGVIHRDIKPGNLLLTKDGHVKLSDFGIARLFGNARLTDAGGVLGTAEYMSPEQAAGGPAGPRADLYSLGAVLYVLLSGRPLFRGNSLPEILHKQQFEQPDLLGQHAPEVPAYLEAIIAQLLEKDPDRRIPNPTALARQLEAMEQALSVEAATGDAAAVDPAADSGGGCDEALASPAAADPHGSSADPLPPTQAEDVSAAESPAPDYPPPLADVLPDTKVTGASKKPETHQTAEEQTGPDGHFTPVAQEELDRAQTEEARTAWISPQTWALAAGLIAVGLALWYMLQNPSADALYKKIKRSTGGSVNSLISVEDDIHEFLMRHAEDRRCEELRQYQQQIQLHLLEQRYERLAKGLTHAEDLAPIERDYLEAIRYAQLDPERGMAKLEALIDLYDRPEGTSGPPGECLELARRRLKQLRTEIASQAAERLAPVEDRLDQADQLRQTEPERARRIYQAVIELYGDKPWAAAAVRRARNALVEMDSFEKQ